MHYVRRIALILTISLPVAAQEPVFPVPPNVKAEGVPPIPLPLADAVARYGEFRSADLLDWHPFERRMLVSTTFGNVPQIHEVRSPGAARTQLTFYRDGVAGGAWFAPSGKYFVFRKDTSGGGEAQQLFRFDPSSGAATLMTDGKSRNGTPAFARTRGLIAYDSTRRDGRNRDIYVMNPEQPSTDRLLVQLEGSWQVLDWSPDDRELLVLESVSSASETYLWRIDSTTGAKTAVTTRGGRPIFWTEARFSSDGRHIYALGDRESDIQRLWRGDLAGGPWRLVTRDGDAVETFAESPDGRRLAVVIDRDAMSHLQILDAADRRQRLAPTLPAGVITRLAWHPKGDVLAFVYAGARTFSDVYTLDPRRGKVERWTFSEMGGANQDSLPDAESIRWTSFDGLSIPGILYRPPARFTGPRPVIINIHGGPELRERPRALGRSNYFRNEMGIAIIYPNVRGSAGFGREFEERDDGRKRADVVKDIGALLDWIATQPYLDRNRVMLTGASYGGYLSLLGAIEYGDRIRCVFEGFGMSDLVTFLESTEESRRADRNIEYGDPADPEMRRFLTTISPLTRAAQLKVPLFISQGGRDTRVPLAQAEAMVKAMRQNNTPLWYVVYTDAGHLQFTRATNDFNTYAWVLFVQRYLLD
jgi:dipeptidyl aminopeptidase/acylaminoacyl peptidase